MDANNRLHINQNLGGKQNEMEEGGCGVMSRRDDLIESLDAIENGMCRIKESRDIWQNDLVYVLCQGVRLLLMDKIKEKQR